MLLGRTAMQRMGIVVSTIHGAIKFNTKKGIGTVLLVGETDEGTKRARKIPATNEERVLMTIGKQLPEHFKKELQNLLKSNAYVFAWTHADMTGILRTIMAKGKPFNMEHKLNEYNHVKPIKQNKRGLGPDRNMAAYKETEELTKAGILRKVKHQTWVANPVMVKKSDGGWRMCVDFTSINKECPKDCYPLPEIDRKIESLSGFRLKCFLDAYKGYHQIQMAEEDEDKIAFYAGGGVFCYKKMSFGLKNAGATYQRLVDKVFSHQIGSNIEAYVDDMVIKSTSERKMLKDIQDLQKVKAVTDLEQPRTLKDIQSLNGKLAALSRFLSKGAERSLAFFKVLKGCKDKKSIHWTTEANKALEKINKLIQALPTLTVPRVNEKETPSDFLVEIPFEDNKKEEKSKEVPDSFSKWRLYTDGASNSDGSGAGLMLIDPEGKEYTYTLRFEFQTTNNEAEYEPLLAGLQIAQEMEIAKVAIFLDSQLLEVPVEVLTKRSIEEKEVLKVDMQKRKIWMGLIHKTQRKLRGSESRIMKHGYYLPSMHKEVAKAIQDCEKCKEQSVIRKSGTSETITAGSTWPFSHWGIHILGPLPMAPGGLQFLAIAVEHSTIWVEAKPLTTINRRQVEKFVWEYVVCKFRVPRIISSKEEKHFKEGMFADLCKGLKVTQSFSPVTEHMEIMHHIERQLTRSQHGWVDNLAKIL
ncbi:reverse transcriptase domain-containing protein [Tanacetum coccineum]